MSIFSSDKTSADDGHINVIAEFHVRPEFLDKVREMLTALVEPTRGEDGCKDYHLLQDKKEQGKLVTYEAWTGEDKLAKHLAGIKDKLEQARPMLVAEPKISTFNHLK